MTSKAEKRVQEYLASGKQLPPSIQEPHTPKNKNGTTNWNAIWDELITLNLAVDEQPAEKKDHSTRVCFLETNGEIYHQTTQGFINQHGEVKTEIHHEGKTYKPIEGEEITKGIVKLADQPEPYGTFKQLLQDSQDLIKEFVDVPDDFIKITALYTALTWVQDRFRTIPYWRVKGDYGTGKSRAWEVAYNLCCNPIPVQGALTSAPVFRLIDRWQILTLCIDESDFANTDTAADITKIINTGFEKIGNVMRCDQNDSSKIQFFRTYCPKLFSMRYPFGDAATESRCLSTDTKATTRQDIPVVLTQSFFERAQKLRNRFLDYRLKNYFKIQPNEAPIFPVRLDGRLKQIALAFYPLFETEEERAWFNEWLINYQKKLREERSMSWQGTILSIIIQQAQDIDSETPEGEMPKHFVTTKTVADALGSKYQTINKETKPLGFESEKKFWYNDGKKHSCSALVVTPENWKKVIDRYSVEEVERPNSLLPSKENKISLDFFTQPTPPTEPIEPT